MFGAGVGISSVAMRGGDPFGLYRSASGITPAMVADFKQARYATPQLGAELADLSTATLVTAGDGTWTDNGNGTYTFTAAAAKNRPGVTVATGAALNEYHQAQVTVTSTSGMLNIGIADGGGNIYPNTAGTHTLTGAPTSTGHLRVTIESASTAGGETFTLSAASFKKLRVGEALRSRSLSDFITVARASSATRRNSSGLIETVGNDVARLDHDANGNPLGILIEPQRTNLLLHSAAFDNTAWNKDLNVTVTADDAVAPDGAVTADRIAALNSVAVTSLVCRQSLSVGAGVHTQSVWLKAGNINKATLRLHYVGAASVQLVVDLTASWKRFEFTQTLDAGTALVDVLPGDWAGSVTAGDYIHAWGAQLEEGSKATSYIPTTTAQVTRAADDPSVKTADFGLNASAGALIVYYTLAGDAPGNERIVVISDGTTNEYIAVDSTAEAGSRLNIRDGAVDQAALQHGNANGYGSQNKAAAAWAVNDVAFSVNGAAVLTDATVTLPTVTKLEIGRGADGVHIIGHIELVEVFAERPPNSDLVSATT